MAQFGKSHEPRSQDLSSTSNMSFPLSKDVTINRPIPQRPINRTPRSSGPRRLRKIGNSPSVIQTPNGRHVDFTKGSSVFETPFTKTLNYFKTHVNKENTPHKVRRNASLPEEIAELAKEANLNELDDEYVGSDTEDLEKYRAMDLALEEPVVENKIAGDLITTNSPNPKPVEQLIKNTDVEELATDTQLTKMLIQMYENPRTEGELDVGEVGIEEPVKVCLIIHILRLSILTEVGFPYEPTSFYHRQA